MSASQFVIGIGAAAAASAAIFLSTDSTVEAQTVRLRKTSNSGAHAARARSWRRQRLPAAFLPSLAPPLTAPPLPQVRRKLSESASAATASAGSSLRDNIKPYMGAAETLTGSFLLDEHLVAEAAARDIQTLNLGRAIADGRREVKITARDLE